MRKARSWSEVPGAVFVELEVAFTSSGSDEPRTHDYPGGRSEERVIEEVCFGGTRLPESVVNALRPYLQFEVDTEDMEAAEDAYVSSCARAKSMDARLGERRAKRVAAIEANHLPTPVKGEAVTA
ncbi:MAG: hypothetical protein ACYTKD_18725 [Planctomycetota bacterium]